MLSLVSGLGMYLAITGPMGAITLSRPEVAPSPSVGVDPVAPEHYKKSIAGVIFAGGMVTLFGICALLAGLFYLAIIVMKLSMLIQDEFFPEEANTLPLAAVPLIEAEEEEETQTESITLETSDLSSDSD